MNTERENRDIEVLFEEVMPGYRCIVSRQPEGAINLQFESLDSHNAITLPAVDPALWDSPEKLQVLCEQIANEFLLLCEERPAIPAEQDGAPIRVSGTVTEKLCAIIYALNNQKEGR